MCVCCRAKTSLEHEAPYKAFVFRFFPCQGIPAFFPRMCYAFLRTRKTRILLSRLRNGNRNDQSRN